MSDTVRFLRDEIRPRQLYMEMERQQRHACAGAYQRAVRPVSRREGLPSWLVVMKLGPVNLELL